MQLFFNKRSYDLNLNMHFACLSVHLYPINVKTAEPIGPEFFVGPRLTLGEGLWMIEFSIDIFMSETRVYNNQNTRLCTQHKCMQEANLSSFSY